MKRYARGFTLIEIAIVLVIIGLLLGGVLKGQELITGARVRNLISQQDGIKAAFFGFQDRYRALPGDYAAADTNINCGANPCAKGNGNGRIESASAPINGSVTHEETLVWSHLTSAGFLNGSYNFADTAATDANTPKNPYGSLLDLENDQQYGQGTGPLKHNLKTGAQIPVEIVAEVDRKIDDGLPYSGAFQFSTYAAPGGTPPVASGAQGCIDTAATPNVWAVRSGSTNCSAGTLF
jgi:prepilin-type N-terminal cleavage/methylation domain-containing protein